MPSPRVVHLVYDLIRGGTEGQCARVTMGLAKRGLPHRVAVFHRQGFFLPAVEEACGPVFELAIRHAARLSTLVEIRRFARWLKAEQAGLLHAWDADAAIFGQFAACWAGIPFITSRRDLGQIYPPWKLALLRRADREAVRVVANAEAVRRHFIQPGLPEEKIQVLLNVLDLEEFDALTAVPFASAERLPAGRRMVVVNRLDPEKNTGLLIEALPLVQRQVPDAVLVVAGDGPDMPMLREMARSLGVAPAVCFLGEVNDVPSLLTCCEAGALVPSRNEGLSNTILEYMAAGLPVLASDCGGNRELVQTGTTGQLVGIHETPETIAAAWMSMFMNRTAMQAMGRSGREAVRRHHAPAHMLDRFAALYNDLRPPKSGYTRGTHDSD